MTLAVHYLTPGAEVDEASYLGRFAEPSDFDTLLRASTRVVRPDGSTLCVLLKGALSKDAGLAMYRAVRKRISITQNRGTAAGGKKPTRVRKDGVLTKQQEAIPVASSIMGFFDRSVRMPFCRKTAFMDHYPEAFRACLPALQEAQDAFQAHMPEAYARQKAVVDKTHPDFVIPKTVFTTITLNKNFRTAFHKDAGDFKDGFGVMSYYRSGRFRGGDLVFPAYRVAVSMDSLDLVLFDPHEVHGNTAIEAFTPEYERITCVHYYRENMFYCGSAQDELRNAQNHDTRRGARNLKVKL